MTFPRQLRHLRNRRGHGLFPRPELARFAANIATWADRYTPPPDQRDDRLARYPYLDRHYGLTEKVPGVTAWILNIHMFAIASSMSFGPSGSSINAMTTAVRKLVDGITGGLFGADVDRHWRSVQSYNVPQAVLVSPDCSQRDRAKGTLR
jgi:FAD-dependent urate hydroxylase